MAWLSNPGYRAKRYRPSGTTPNAPVAGLITRRGQKLYRNGQEFLFTGVNIYNANSDGNYSYSLATGTAFDDVFTKLSGIEIIRAWFGQWLAHPKSDLTWQYFDHTLNKAHSYGKQVIVVLADQDGSWCDGIKKTYDSNWYQSGYRTTVSRATSPWGTRNTMTYRDFVAAVVNRYKNHPGVAFWQLINEAEIKPADPARESPELERAGAAAIRAWADDMAGLIKSIDAQHLVSLGTIGTGQFGTSGDHFEMVHAGPNIDLVEMHDYVPHEDIIGDRFNGMELRLRQAARLNKPLFVGEVGINPNVVGGLARRAERIRSKIVTQRSRGVVGHVAWELRNGPDPIYKGDDYDFLPDDPMMDVLRSL